MLADLVNGIAPGTQVILHGPRGNGKTVLLAWLEAECASGSEVDVARRTPSEIPDRERLAEELLPESWWERYAPAEVAVAGVRWRPGEGPAPSPRAVLSARAAKRPFVLLVDEAHTLGLEVGRALLNAAQQVGSKAPFLLVLAGTPNLEGRLNAMGASFWNRAEQIRVGRLREAATVEAFRRPFEQEAIAVTDEALGELVRESQRYPYFIQLLGQAVWREQQASPREVRTVSPSGVEKARPRFERVRGEYYAQRFEELTRHGLLGVGRAVADGFRRREVLERGELEGAIRAGLGDAAGPERERAAWQELLDLGFLWRVEARPEWEPGIPSLMDYVRQHAPAR